MKLPLVVALLVAVVSGCSKPAAPKQQGCDMDASRDVIWACLESKCPPSMRDLPDDCEHWQTEVWKMHMNERLFDIEMADWRKRCGVPDDAGAR